MFQVNGMSRWNGSDLHLDEYRSTDCRLRGFMDDMQLVMPQL